MVGQLCKTNPQKEAEYDELLIEGMARGTNAEVMFRVGNLMNRENMKTALVNQAKRDEKLKKRSLKKKSEQFTARKLVGVSIQKTNRLLSAFHSSVSCAGVEIGNEAPKATKYSEQKFREEMRNTKYFPEVKTFPKEIIPKEQAYIKLRDLLKQVVHLVFTIPQLRKHFHSFYNVQRQEVDWKHFKIGICFDGYPLFSTTKQGACMVAIQILNLIGLVQIPKYSWVQSFIVDKEQGKYTWYMLVDLDNDIFDIAQNGMEVDFFDTTANIRYPTPYFKLHVDHMMNPICEAKDYATSLEERRSDFERVKVFWDGNLKLHHKEKAQIQSNKKLTSDQKRKQTMNSYLKFMRTQVNDKAASIQTCCIHNSPLFMASCAPVEVLHMDLNIFVKLCEHPNVKCRQLTLDHNLYETTFCKKTELVPEWSTCPASSPARKFIQVFESAGQTKLALPTTTNSSTLVRFLLTQVTKFHRLVLIRSKNS